MENGKAIVSNEIISEMIQSFGIQSGATITIG
jgi:hypothetical protein